jgi:hypothetical protein
MVCKMKCCTVWKMVHESLLTAWVLNPVHEPRIANWAATVNHQSVSTPAIPMVNTGETGQCSTGFRTGPSPPPAPHAASPWPPPPPAACAPTSQQSFLALSTPFDAPLFCTRGYPSSAVEYCKGPTSTTRLGTKSPTSPWPAASPTPPTPLPWAAQGAVEELEGYTQLKARGGTSLQSLYCLLHVTPCSRRASVPSPPALICASAPPQRRHLPPVSVLPPCTSPGVPGLS